MEAFIALTRLADLALEVTFLCGLQDHFNFFKLFWLVCYHKGINHHEEISQEGAFSIITVSNQLTQVSLCSSGWFFFSFSMKCQSVNIKFFIVVLQIPTFIHILDRKYHISTYHISIILFSSTIWWFHLRFFFNLKFFGDFIQKNLFIFYGLNISPNSLMQIDNKSPKEKN